MKKRSFIPPSHRPSLLGDCVWMGKEKKEGKDEPYLDRDED